MMETLENLKHELLCSFQDVSLRGQGSASFLFVTNRGRSVEISQNDGKWWLEFWEASSDEDSSSVREITLATSEQAIDEAVKWLR
jgi:hypothetical protein